MTKVETVLATTTVNVVATTDGYLTSEDGDGGLDGGLAPTDNPAAGESNTLTITIIDASSSIENYAPVEPTATLLTDTSLSSTTTTCYTTPVISSYPAVDTSIVESTPSMSMSMTQTYSWESITISVSTPTLSITPDFSSITTDLSSTTPDLSSTITDLSSTTTTDVPTSSAVLSSTTPSASTTTPASGAPGCLIPKGFAFLLSVAVAFALTA